MRNVKSRVLLMLVIISLIAVSFPTVSASESQTRTSWREIFELIFNTLLHRVQNLVDPLNCACDNPNSDPPNKHEFKGIYNPP